VNGTTLHVRLEVVLLSRGLSRHLLSTRPHDDCPARTQVP
jgi:hypothetical protein